MKLEKYIANFSTLPLLTGAVLLGTTIENMNILHMLAMILLIIGGVFMGTSLKRN